MISNVKMDKYTVDIDKVLDAFEESEALQINHQSSETTRNQIPSSSCTSRLETCDGLYVKSSLIDNCYTFPIPLFSKDESSSVEKKCNLPEQFVTASEATGMSYVLQDQDITADNKSCRRSFHVSSLTECVKSVLSPSVNEAESINFSKTISQACNEKETFGTTSGSFNIDDGSSALNVFKGCTCSIVSSREQTLSENENNDSLPSSSGENGSLKNLTVSDTLQNSIKNSVKCVKKENSDTTVTEISKQKTYSLSKSELNNITAISEKVVLQSLQDQSYANKSLNSLVNLPHVSAADDRTSDQLDLQTNMHSQNHHNIVIDDKENCTGADKCFMSEDEKIVSFSDVNSQDVSVEEMDAYLNNLTNDNDIQDKDSGVSSQEDINGNNFPPDDFTSMTSKILQFSESDSEKICIEKNIYLSSSTFSSYSKCLQSNAGNCSNILKKNVPNLSCELKSDNSICCDENSVIQYSSVFLSDTDTLSSKKNDTKAKLSETNIFGKVIEVSLNSANKCNSSDEISKNKNVIHASCMESKISDDHSCESISEQQDADILTLQSHASQFMNSETEKRGSSYFLQEDNSCPLTVNEKVSKDSASKCFSIFNNVLPDYLEDKYISGDIESKSFSDDNIVSQSTDDCLCITPRIQRPTTLDLPSRISVIEVNSNISVENLTVSSADASTDLVNCSNSSRSGTEEFMFSELEASESSHSQLGYSKPFWVPDEDATNCMHCNLKFTVIKRRHHCRACGKVLCSRCCNQKTHLPYLLNKEDRVCYICYEILTNTSNNILSNDVSESPVSSSCGSSPNFSPAQANVEVPIERSWRPRPSNPDDYCSTIPPLQQIQSMLNCPPPTVMVPVGVLKRDNKPRREPKQVIFSDGIRPGGDLTDLTEPLEAIPPCRRQGRKRIDKITGDCNLGNFAINSVKKKLHPRNSYKRLLINDTDGPLPPILLPLDSFTENEEICSMEYLLLRLQDEEGPIIFALTKNLHVLVKLVNLDCCHGKKCWCFTSHGFCAVAQDEVVLVLECLPDEDVIPRDVFRLFSKIHDNASKGLTVGELNHIVFPEGMFGNSEHRGCLFIRPTIQCLKKLTLPVSPFLVAILIKKWEVPWAKTFPLRLMLRLGAECRHYPCSLVNIRFRKSVYFEIGQTIMSVLADLRNYQFTIPEVPGLVVHMEDKKTFVNIPRNRYEKLMKVLSSNNVEHVLALGSNFSTEADSHLVCMQNDDGDYQTQAISIKNATRKVTGANFIVFSGALKSSTGLSAKFGIVEDGVHVQLPQETMATLHSALKDMRDFIIECGQIGASEPDFIVHIQWTKDDKKFNIGVVSPVNGKSLEGVQSLRIHASTDYTGDNYLIRWTEVFFIETDKNGNNRRNETIDVCRLAETVAQASCLALTPYLDQLADADLTKIGLRVTLDSERDKVEYEVGSHGHPLPSLYMNALDSGLIPIISRITSTNEDEPITLELIFYILVK